MKIAHFSDAFLPNVNGVSFSVDAFSLEQAKRHQVKLFVPAYLKGKVFERRGKVEIHRYYSLPIPTYKDAHLTVPDILDIYKLVHEFSPDVIHFHSPGTMGLMGILAAKILRRPLVGTYHTLFAEMLDYISVRKLLDKYLVAIDKAAAGVGLDFGILRNGEQLKEGETTAQRMTWSVVNRIYNYADAIICPSAAIERELVKRKVKPAKLHVISNGMDIKKFIPKRDYRTLNKLVHVGRLGYEKNVDVVIKAFERICRQLPKLTLVIAGDGPAKKDLERLTRELGIAGRVKLLGMVRRDKLPWVYRDADIFVTASDMETLGMVVLEAEASGLPVVAVDKYALTDLVDEGVNGYKVISGDFANMADRILKLLASEELRFKMGKAARERAIEQNLEDKVLEMEGLYQRIGSKSELAEPKKVSRM